MNSSGFWGLTVIFPGVEAEGEQGQPEPTQIQPSTGAGSSDAGVNPDLRRQLGLILQTAGRSQVEKMLRELVREQGQGGKRRSRKKTPKDGGKFRGQPHKTFPFWGPPLGNWGGGRFGGISALGAGVS